MGKFEENVGRGLGLKGSRSKSQADDQSENPRPPMVATPRRAGGDPRVAGTARSLWPARAAEGERGRLAIAALAIKAHRNGLAGLGAVVAITRMVVADEAGALALCERSTAAAPSLLPPAP